MDGSTHKIRFVGWLNIVKMDAITGGKSGDNDIACETPLGLSVGLAVWT